MTGILIFILFTICYLIIGIIIVKIMDIIDCIICKNKEDRLK